MIRAALVAALLAATPAAAEQIVGVPSDVHDGDTLRLGEFRIRLGDGVDAYELRQQCGPVPCGLLARDTLQALVAGHTLTCTRTGKSYDRVVATCLREDGVDVGLEMLKSPYATLDERYATPASRAAKCTPRAWRARTCK